MNYDKYEKAFDYIRKFHSGLKEGEEFEIGKVYDFAVAEGFQGSENTIYQQVRIGTTNCKGRIGDGSAKVNKGDGRDLFYQVVSRKNRRKYDPEKDPEPLYYEDKPEDPKIEEEETTPKEEFLTEIFDAHDLETYPDYGGVYILWLNNGYCWYIGKAKSVRSRLMGYKNEMSKRLDPDLVIKAEFIFIPEKKQRKTIEDMLIKYLRPILNKKGVRDPDDD